MAAPRTPLNVPMEPSLTGDPSLAGAAGVLPPGWAGVGTPGFVPVPRPGADAACLAAGVAADGAPPARPESGRAAEGRARGLSVLSLGAVVSAVIMVIGWVHSSGSGRQGVAAEGLTLSLSGLLVALAGVAAFLMPSRSRLAARRAHLLRRFVLADAAAVTPTATSTNGASGDAVLVADGLSRYHRPGCPAVSGVATTRTARAAIGAALRPCDLCEPGEQR